MTAARVEQPLRVVSHPRPALLPRTDPTPAQATDDFQPWEIHSELTLVDPELRRRLIELLPEIDLDARPVTGPRPILLSPPAPVVAIAHHAPPPMLENEQAVETIGVLRYMVHRVVAMARFGLAIVGAIFTLAMLAELVAR